MDIFIFRRDFRLHDNTCLIKQPDKQMIPIFIFDDD